MQRPIRLKLLAPQWSGPQPLKAWASTRIYEILEGVAYTVVTSAS